MTAIVLCPRLCQSKWLEADRAVASRLGMHNPFRYFNSSPEVIRLAVMMYIRYPLSLRQVEDLLFAAEIRKRRIHHRSFSQWRWHLDEVFVRINGESTTCGGPLITNARSSIRHEAPGLQGCAEVPEANDEALWAAEIARDRPTSLGWCRDEGYWGRRSSGMRTMAQQPGRKLTPTVPTTRGRDGQVQGYQDATKVCVRSRLHPQPFQSRSPSKPPRHIQESPISRTVRVASACGLKFPAFRLLETGSI